MNINDTPEERAHKLIANMNLTEKIDMVDLQFYLY